MLPVAGEAARAIRVLGAEWSGADHDHLLSRWTPVDARLGQLGSDLAHLAEAPRLLGIYAAPDASHPGEGLLGTPQGQGHDEGS